MRRPRHHFFGRGMTIAAGLVMSAALALSTVGIVGTPLSASSVAGPRTSAAHGQGTLLIIGDSLTVGANAFGALATKTRRLTYEGAPMWNKVVLDAKVGRTIAQGIKVLSSRLDSLDDVTAIVIALGTNDMISRREPRYPAQIIDQMMIATRDIPVLWTNLKYSPTGRGDWRFRGRRFNRALSAAAGEWSTLTVSNWDAAFTPQGASRFIADGVHLTATGYRTRANHTISQLRAFGTQLVLSTTTTTLASTTTSTSTTTTTTPPETSSVVNSPVTSSSTTSSTSTTP